MEYHDKVLKCAECSQEFVFTAGEQMFFADKGFKNEPKRCKDCKAKRSQSPGPGNILPTVGNQDDLLAVRKGNYRSFPPDAGSARVLPRMFPTAAVHERTGVARGRSSQSPLATSLGGAANISLTSRRHYPPHFCAIIPPS